MDGPYWGNCTNFWSFASIAMCSTGSSRIQECKNEELFAFSGIMYTSAYLEAGGLTVREVRVLPHYLSVRSPNSPSKFTSRVLKRIPVFLEPRKKLESNTEKSCLSSRVVLMNKIKNVALNDDYNIPKRSTLTT